MGAFSCQGGYRGGVSLRQQQNDVSPIAHPPAPADGLPGRAMVGADVTHPRARTVTGVAANPRPPNNHPTTTQ